MRVRGEVVKPGEEEPGGVGGGGAGTSCVSEGENICLSETETDVWVYKGGGNFCSFGASEGGAEAIGAIPNLSSQAWFVATFLVAKKR